MSVRSEFDAYVHHPRHGPLPAILILLTLGTGLVDATSILGLGRVFVANMTGNIVFIGFALAGAPGFSLWGSVVALVAFLVGASLGGVFVHRFAGHRGRLLRNALVVQSVLVLMALLGALSGPGPAVSLAIVAGTAVALGIQNAVVRHLAVPDLTTTVLTMTLTGIAADLRARDVATAARRAASVAAMLVGAFCGAVLVLRFGVVGGLAAVLVVTVGALLAATVSSRSVAPWSAPVR